MQSLRTNIQRVPRRLSCISKPSRSFTNTPAAMSLFPRFTQEFAPIFRLFDEYDRQAFRGLDNHVRSMRSFTPKFDVKETENAYELHGELPGVDQKDINIEWTDSNTLTVSGKHEHVREEGQRPQAIEDTTPQKSLEHQPTVEDETNGSTTPANQESQVAAQSQQQEVTKAPEEANQSRYWVSERSVGEFHRSFAFPARIDQDAVKASLKNGILSIAVPKAKKVQARKINIE